jgi:hypothetical protein
MSRLKPYPIWPWLCTVFFTASLAFSFSSLREIEARYAQFIMVERKGLTTWGQQDGVDAVTHKAKMEASYDSVMGEVRLFGVLAGISGIVAVSWHLWQNKKLRALT